MGSSTAMRVQQVGGAGRIVQRPARGNTLAERMRWDEQKSCRAAAAQRARRGKWRGSSAHAGAGARRNVVQGRRVQQAGPRRATERDAGERRKSRVGSRQGERARRPPSMDEMHAMTAAARAGAWAAAVRYRKKSSSSSALLVFSCPEKGRGRKEKKEYRSYILKIPTVVVHGGMRKSPIRDETSRCSRYKRYAAVRRGEEMRMTWKNIGQGKMVHMVT